MNQTAETEAKDEVSRWAEGRLEQEPQEAAVTKAFPCPMCEASFDTQQQRQGHMSGKHRRSKKTRTKMSREEKLAAKRAYNKRYRARLKQHNAGAELAEVPHYKTPEYRRKQYLKLQRRYKRLGLDAHGKPRNMSARGLRNIRIAQKARREREAMLNGSAPHQPQQTPEPRKLDIAGAAEQIVQCAQTLVNLAQMNRIP